MKRLYTVEFSLRGSEGCYERTRGIASSFNEAVKRARVSAKKRTGLSSLVLISVVAGPLVEFGS